MDDARRQSGSFLGRGWSFPPEFDRVAGGVKMVSDVEDIRESLEILLSTRRGERVMHPTFGCSIHDLVFGPLDASTVADIRNAIERAILFFEPRIRLNGVDVTEALPEEGRLRIEIDFTVRLTNTRSNMVWDFYILEATL